MKKKIISAVQIQFSLNFFFDLFEIEINNNLNKKRKKIQKLAQSIKILYFTQHKKT